MTTRPEPSALPPADAALLERLLAAELARAPAPLRRWYPAAELAQALKNELHEGVVWLRDEAFGRAFAASCPVPGAAPADYCNRRLELPLLGEALVGIRFRGLDLERPFVEVVASQRTLEPGAALGPLQRALRDAFTPFAPRHLALYQPVVDGVALDRFAGAFWDLRWLAAPLAQLRGAPLPQAAARLQLERPAALGFYLDYRRILAQRFARTPQLREYTYAETARDLETLRRQGTLFVLRVEGRPAGLIAVERSSRRGLRGFLMIEIVLARWAGGRGLGTAAQLLLARMLDGRPGDVLFGTIHADNRAALRTARRAGRVDVGGDLWLPLGAA